MSAPAFDRRRLRNIGVMALLLILSAACATMLDIRMRHTGSVRYAFMSWNLFLAWIPLGTAFLADEASTARPAFIKAFTLPLAVIWLVFLPNAPYVATDLIHLEPRAGVPYWYDGGMMLAFAGTGLLLGLASLLFMQDVAGRLFGSAVSWLFAAGALVIAAFGVYLGRFERFNSWEVFSSPSLVLREAWLQLGDPVGYSRAYEFTGLLAALMLAAYVVIFGLSRRGLRLLGGRPASR